MAAVRVAFDSGPLHGPRTGIGHAVAALSDALTARDDVEVLPYLTSFRARPTDGTVRLPLPAALAHRVWPVAALHRPMRRTIDRWLPPVDIVHGTNYVAPPTAHHVVVSVYDCWFLRNPQLATSSVHRAGRVLRTAIAHGAVVHTSSHATEAAIRELFPGARVRTVHLGALPLPAPSLSEPIPGLAHTPYVLAVGTLERRKNIPALVAAFGAIAAQHPDLLLVLAGSDGDDADAVRAAVDALGPLHAPRVMFTGRIDEPTRGWLLRQATVLAYPSLDEGFGFPVLDGFQAGVPVVASTAGSIPEVAGDAALLHPSDDVDLLSAALHTALTDHATRERLITAGTERWPRFTWTACAEQMVALYGHVLDGSLDSEATRRGDMEGRQG